MRFDWIEPLPAAHPDGAPAPAAGGAPATGALGAPAFVVRFDARPRAYLNRCAHRAVELDWLPGRFFDQAGLYLVCAMHGALYRADTGHCVAGPCQGAALIALRCEERNGRVRVACPVPGQRVGMFQ